MSDSVTKWYETNTPIPKFMSDREIMNAKSGNTNKRKASEILKEEYPTIYAGYMDIVEEQLELFSKKHLDYGMDNISAGTGLSTKEERDFALSGLWYRMSDKISRWKNLILSSRGPQNETIIDTFQDVCNYAIIAQLVQRNKWRR